MPPAITGGASLLTHVVLQAVGLHGMVADLRATATATRPLSFVVDVLFLVLKGAPSPPTVFSPTQSLSSTTMRLSGLSVLLALPLAAIAAIHGHHARNHHEIAKRAPGDVGHLQKRFSHARFTYYAVGL